MQIVIIKQNFREVQNGDLSDDFSVFIKDLEMDTGTSLPEFNDSFIQNIVNTMDESLFL